MLRKLFDQAKDKAVQLEPVAIATQSLWQHHCASLSPPEPYQATLKTAIQTALSQPGCHIVVGLPPETQFLTRSLKRQRAIQAWHCLDHLPNTVPGDAVIIPNLGTCFERSISGFTALAHLAQMIQSAPQATWLIGCSSWLWHYLGLTLQWEAVATTTTPLPKLTGLDLRRWLAGSSSLALVPSATPAFYDRLVSQAHGSAQVAAALWLEALRIDAQGQICLGEVVCPELPSLTDISRFVLYSLLLQPSLTSLDLAAILGCDQHQAQGQLQTLLRAGLVTLNSADQADQYSIQPLYYPSIQAALASNNFSVP